MEAPHLDLRAATFRARPAPGEHPDFGCAQRTSPAGGDASKLEGRGHQRDHDVRIDEVQLIYAERPPAGEVRGAQAKSGCTPGAGQARTVAARKARALSGLMARPAPRTTPPAVPNGLPLTTPPQLFKTRTCGWLGGAWGCGLVARGLAACAYDPVTTFSKTVSCC